ncbi:MAG TPA: glycosyltransferase family 2 protein [Candidatus Kapabacteria bacterium]|nr:glycosyltransferase family 2 protein [Candidatus Kapabacteria bacterium]
MELVKVSVIITFYNELDFQVHRSIKSVLEQTFQNFELILLLASPNNLMILSILNQYKNTDSRVKVIVTSKNSYVSVARNLGINEATSEYIAILDGDDEFLPTKLEKQYNYMVANPEIDMLGTYTIWKIENDINSEFYYKIGEVEEFIKHQVPLPQTTLMLKKSSVEKYGYYNELIRYGQDYDFEIRWYCSGAKLEILREYLVNYYKVPSKDSNLTRQQVMSGIKIKLRYAKQLKLGIKHYIKIFLYDFPIFVLLPQSFLFKAVFIKNKLLSNNKK